MKFAIVGKNIKVTEAIEAKIVKKLNQLEKYFLIKDTTDCRVVVSCHDNDQKIEVTIPTSVALLRGEVTDRDLYNAIDLVVDKLEDQIRYAKTRMDRTHREHLGKAFAVEMIKDIEEFNDIPVKTKSISVERLDLDEAISQMELLGHSFFIYRDEEEGKIAVVYKRNQGGYGLIEVE